MEKATKEVSHAQLETALRAFVAEPSFPCVGAKSAAATGGLVCITAEDLHQATDDGAILSALTTWAYLYGTATEGFRSLAVIFREPRNLDEAEFETAMWARLQALATRDAKAGARPDPTVSSDPGHADFALSFGGEAFFVVGLHPSATRPARRFAHPTLVFNLHAQFVRLREAQLYERMRAQIMKRDLALAGSLNPMLAEHGARSAARQYSGRAVGEDWVCPFHDPRA